ncbi:hypothetical protein B0T24DRAFT_596818 [Lasiosphaeria ovina]|uniref:GPI anchored protein n=1 Tax=Lasiosphaeria ovina TaxID=92902 RepID=A0AAE0JZ03_9PEZI|nr:hypothetical protein B0T24DRAFT_596818 [Lasiosphaeria ovina]
MVQAPLLALGALAAATISTAGTPTTTAAPSKVAHPDPARLWRRGQAGQHLGWRAPVGRAGFSRGCVSGITVVQGASTYMQIMTFSGGEETLNCKLSSNNAACVAAATSTIPYSDPLGGTGVSGVGYTLPTSVTGFAESYAVASVAVAVTATLGSALPIPTVATTNTTAGTAAVSTAASSSTTSGAGVPRATQNAVPAGVAAVVGGVMYIV